MTSRYICTWNAGAVTFFVEDMADGTRRVTHWEPQHTTATKLSPEEDVLIRRALVELNAHLGRTATAFIWYPPLDLGEWSPIDNGPDDDAQRYLDAGRCLMAT